MLTGTSFGTSATIGVICMSMGISAGTSPLLLGGAILSGAFFGDRCSPFSTSALLVSELTKTSIFDNIKNMLRSAWLPFLITCMLYGVLGFQFHSQAAQTDLTALFSREVTLHPAALLPAAVILILALIRILRDVPDARRVIVRPDPANVASRQTLLAAGFAYDADNQLFILRSR